MLLLADLERLNAQLVDQKEEVDNLEASDTEDEDDKLYSVVSKLNRTSEEAHLRETNDNESKVDSFSLENVRLVKDNSLLETKQNIGFEKAEKYHSFLSVSNQEKDNKIVQNFPKVSLVPKSERSQNCREILAQFEFQLNYTQIEVRSVFDLLLVSTPTDHELLPPLPLYLTTYSNSLNLSLSQNSIEDSVFSFIQQSWYNGTSFQAIVDEFKTVSEFDLLQTLKYLISVGAVLALGTLDLKFCSWECCPFFTSLKTNDAVLETPEAAFG